MMILDRHWLFGSVDYNITPTCNNNSHLKNPPAPLFSVNILKYVTNVPVDSTSKR